METGFCGNPGPGSHETLHVKNWKDSLLLGHPVTTLAWLIPLSMTRDDHSSNCRHIQHATRFPFTPGSLDIEVSWTTIVKWCHVRDV